MTNFILEQFSSVLSQCKSNKNLEPLYEYVDTINFEFPYIAIPSYKFRTAKMFESLRTEGITKRTKIFIFIEENDFYDSGYDKYDFSEFNVIKYKLNNKVNRISEIRNIICNHMRDLGVTKFFMIDDDVHNLIGATKPKDGTRYNAYKALTWHVFLTTTICLNRLHDCAILGCGLRHSLKFYNYKNDINIRGAFIFVLLDLEKVDKLGLKYCEDTLIHEDCALEMELLIHGFKVAEVPFLCAEGLTKTSFNYDTYGLLKIGTYLKYPQFMDLRFAHFKNKSLWCTLRTRYKKAYGLSRAEIEMLPYDHELYDVCKANNSYEKMNNIKEFLIERKKAKADGLADW